MSVSPCPRHLLHLFPTFDVGGAQVRTCTLIKALGERYRHTIVALDGRFACAAFVGANTPVEYVTPAIGSRKWQLPLALARLIRGRQPNLVLTYNWGAIDGIIGAWLGGSRRIIHAEDGFGPDEALALKRRRSLARRLLLRGVTRVVAPSRQLLRLCNETWRVPPHRAVYLPNGIDLKRYQPGINRVWRERLGWSDDEIVVGCVAQLRAEKGHELLIRAFAEARKSVSLKLLLVGDGPERPRLEALTRELGIDADVVFHGSTHEPERAFQTLDIFALASVTEQMPICLMEAMASGLPVVSTAVGDVADMVPLENRPYLLATRDTDAYATALVALARDRGLRKRLGARNREECVRRFNQNEMIERYANLYEESLAA